MPHLHSIFSSVSLSFLFSKIKSLDLRGNDDLPEYIARYFYKKKELIKSVIDRHMKEQGEEKMEMKRLENDNSEKEWSNQRKKKSSSSSRRRRRKREEKTKKTARWLNQRRRNRRRNNELLEEKKEREKTSSSNALRLSLSLSLFFFFFFFFHKCSPPVLCCLSWLYDDTHTHTHTHTHTYIYTYFLYWTSACDLSYLSIYW